MSKLRYFAVPNALTFARKSAQNSHSEFLRTGKIIRRQDDWLTDEKRYLTHEEVAERTAKRLEVVGETTYERLNAAHRAIRFPKAIFQKTLEGIPHLGYCHVTAARTNFANYADVNWSFYIANFNAEIGGEESFFEQITPHYGRMYFAIALKPGADKRQLTIDRTIRENGLLFRTNDPKAALKNLLMLGAKDPALRAVIAKA